MSMAGLTLAATISLVAFPGLIIAADASSPLTLSSAQVLVVKNGVKAQLKDPDSAKFRRKFQATTAPGETTVCGYVNARNSFGGYTGDQPFYGLLLKSGMFFMIGIGGSKIDSEAVRLMCAKAGIRL